MTVSAIAEERRNRNIRLAAAERKLVRLIAAQEDGEMGVVGAIESAAADVICAAVEVGKLAAPR